MEFIELFIVFFLCFVLELCSLTPSFKGLKNVEPIATVPTADSIFGCQVT